METRILRVEAQTEPTQVTKKDGTQIAKCYVRLKELGSDYSDEYQAAVLGNLATVKLEKGELVVASLRFQTHEANGAVYQDVTAQDLQRLNEVKAF